MQMRRLRLQRQAGVPKVKRRQELGSILGLLKLCPSPVSCCFPGQGPRPGVLETEIVSTFLPDETLWQSCNPSLEFKVGVRQTRSHSDISMALRSFLGSNCNDEEVPATDL